MLFSKPKQIEVKEYTNASVTTPHARLIPINSHPNLVLSNWKLSIALARTLCSNHLNQREFYFDVLNSIFSLTLIVHRPSFEFKLNSTRFLRLRDFSRTNKIGELGQAIAWIYLMESGYPYINDFHFFCSCQNIFIPINSSTPDFIAQKSNLSADLCLAEAKGKAINNSTPLKSSLSKGLNQCNIGDLIIKTQGFFQVAKKMVFCTEFSNEKDSSNSVVNFSDPESPRGNDRFNDLPLRIHYASWFYLIRDFRNVERLISGKSIYFDENEYEKKEINGKQFWVTKLFDRIERKLYYKYKLILEDFFHSYSIYRKYKNIKLGIADEVIQYLKNDYTQNSFELYKSDSNENYELFSDGTIVLDFLFKNK